jgi:hypothetical protein
VLDQQRLQLGAMGVRTPVTEIIHGAIRHGPDYEDRRYTPESAIPTPMNCFMVILHNQPELREKLPIDQFEHLAQIISRLSITVQVIYDRNPDFKWPEACKSVEES